MDCCFSTRKGRAVLVSPSVEMFLGGRPGELRGLHVSEIFPADHPIRSALQFDGDEIEPPKARK